MATLKYWLWLSTRRGLGTLTAVRVLERFGTPEAAYFADDGAYDTVEGLSRQGKDSLADKDLGEADRILAECDRLGCRLLTLQDAAYPQCLRSIADPPLLLYLKGELPRVDEELVIGMVGARKATPYGRKTAGSMAMDLGRAGAVICSGVAEGIDSACIRGALSAGGRVISVVAGGLDVIQMGSSRALYDDIAALGALVSEYPPGTPCASGHFRPRNRIISGLSAGVVVVEGGAASGALITAHAALEQGREVFAVPGNVDAPMSVAPNRLIHDQEAMAVRHAADVLAEFLPRFSLKLGESMDADTREQRLSEVMARTERSEGKQKERPSPVSETKAAVLTLDDAARAGLTDDQRDILLALDGKSIHPDDLVEQLQIPARRVLSALTLLQLQGYVKEENGKRFTACVRLN